MLDISGRHVTLHAQAMVAIKKAREVCEAEGVEPSAENVILALEGARGIKLRRPKLAKVLRAVSLAFQAAGTWVAFAVSYRVLVREWPIRHLLRVLHVIP